VKACAKSTWQEESFIMLARASTRRTVLHCTTGAYVAVKSIPGRCWDPSVHRRDLCFNKAPVGERFRR